MNGFTIGLSALSVASKGLDLVGQNIANASTPGYHRQRLDLVARTSGGLVGTGVDIASVTRYTDDPTRAAIVSGNGVEADASARLDVRQQVQTTLGSGTDGLDAQIGSFFSQIQQLTSTPDDLSVRRTVLASASALATQFNTTAAGLDSLRQNVGTQITQSVSAINSAATQIADLNNKIAVAEAAGGQPNDLLDQRDQLIDTLSQQIDVRTVAQPNGVVNVLSSGAFIVVGEFANSFQATSDPSGNIVLTQAGSTQPVSVASGTLGGLLQEYNQDLPATRGRLDALANSLVQKLNAVQATGLGTSGPLTQATGTQSVADPTAPLSTQNLPIPLQAGNLVVSVTDTASGQRTNSTIAIDPATQSLQDIAAAITSGTAGAVQASVDPTTNALKLQAQAGKAFDFAGRVPNPPTAVNMGGTSVPTVDGVYTGSANDQYNFQITGSGTVGQTDGLQLQVTDSANNVVATLNVGSGYTPGTSLTVANGITVKLSAGTTANGTFSAPLTANSDTAGVLPALGVNGLFTGTNATSIAVKSSLLSDPSGLSASRSGEPGDETNLERFAALQDAATVNGLTFAQDATDQASSVGTQVSQLSDQQSAQSGILQSLSAQEQSVTGVDTNEELLNLLSYQRMTQAASQYMSAVNTALDSVLNILR